MKTALFITAITTTSSLKLSKIASHLSQWQAQEKYDPLNKVITTLKGLEQTLSEQREEEKKAYEEISCTELEQRNRAVKNLEYFGEQCTALSSERNLRHAESQTQNQTMITEFSNREAANDEVTRLNGKVRALNARDERETANLERNIRQLDVAIDHLASLSANTNRKAHAASKNRLGKEGKVNQQISDTTTNQKMTGTGGNTQIQELARKLRKEAVEALRQNSDQIENERNALSQELSSQQIAYQKADTSYKIAKQKFEIAQAALQVASDDYDQMDADKTKTTRFFNVLEETSRNRKAENDQRKKSQSAEISAIKGAIQALSENKLAKREMSFFQKSMSSSRSMGQVFDKLNALGKSNEAVSKVLMLAQLSQDPNPQNTDSLRTLLSTIDTVIAQKNAALAEDSTESNKAQTALNDATTKRDESAANVQQYNSAFDTQTNKYLNAKAAEEEANRLAKEANADLKESRKQCDAEQKRYTKDNEELTSGLNGINGALGFLNKYYVEYLKNDQAVVVDAPTNTAANSNSSGAGGDVTSARGMVVNQNRKGKYGGAGRFVLDSVQAIYDQTETQIQEALKEHKDYQDECKISQYAGKSDNEANPVGTGSETPKSGMNAGDGSYLQKFFDQTQKASKENGKKTAANTARGNAERSLEASKKRLKKRTSTLQMVKEQYFTMEDFDEGQERRMAEIAGLVDARKIVRAFMLQEEK